MKVAIGVQRKILSKGLKNCPVTKVFFFRYNITHIFNISSQVNDVGRRRQTYYKMKDFVSSISAFYSQLEKKKLAWFISEHKQ